MAEGNTGKPEVLKENREEPVVRTVRVRATHCMNRAATTVGTRMLLTGAKTQKAANLSEPTFKSENIYPSHDASPAVVGSFGPIPRWYI